MGEDVAMDQGHRPTFAQKLTSNLSKARQTTGMSMDQAHQPIFAQKVAGNPLRATQTMVKAGQWIKAQKPTLSQKLASNPLRASQTTGMAMDQAQQPTFTRKLSSNPLRASKTTDMAMDQAQQSAVPQKLAGNLLRASQTAVKMNFDVLKKSIPSKPVCLHFTQGRCTKIDDDSHLKTFSHSFPDLDAKSFDLKNVQPQQFDFFLVLDLEGSIEILEFPVLMIDAKTLGLVDFFHRFVRPTRMRKEQRDQYVDQHYGTFGINNVWHETAIPFKEVIQQFEDWLTKHNVWAKESGGHLNKGAFISCGNWDIKTKIPEQYKVAGMKLPPYFMKWINLKDVYLNFYNRRAKGMLAMMAPLRMSVVGNHHLGIDDTTNIARVLQRLIIDGSVLQITGRRKSDGKVEFLFENRI